MPFLTKFATVSASRLTNFPANTCGELTLGAEDIGGGFGALESEPEHAATNTADTDVKKNIKGALPDDITFLHVIHFRQLQHNALISLKTIQVTKICENL